MGLYVPIKVIIADDHELLRDGFTVMIKKQADIEVIGEACNGEELIDITRQLHPDVIVTDIRMPRMNGIDATKQIKKEFPHIEIIALSMFDDNSVVVEMLEAGAKGYLLKNAGKDEIIAAIKSVYKGDIYYCRQTSRQLTTLIAKSNFNPFRKIGWSEFSEKEIQVIRLICKEHSNREIAGILRQSKRTVEGYRQQIMEKTGAKNTAGVVVFAIKNNIYIP